MESKFLNQDVNVVSLANKGIVIGCFVGRNYNKILMETRKLTDNIICCGELQSLTTKLSVVTQTNRSQSLCDKTFL